MQVEYVKGFTVSGFTIRTTNRDEMSPSTARIGQLWHRFYSETDHLLLPESKIYGVYTGYQSDYTGAFDVVAATDMLSNIHLKDIQSIDIQGGRYLIFSAEGEMPETCIGLWSDIWHYFQSGNSEYLRAYTTDFEYYESSEKIKIYISIM